MRWISTLFAGLVVFSATLAAGPLSGRRAPGFALPDVNFNYHDLYDYRGKVVLLEIMRTNCPVCNTFQKTLEKVRARFGPRVQILTIVVPPDTTATVGQFIAQHNVKTPILFDMGQATASYLKATPQKSEIVLPHIFLIDANGWIKNDYVYQGGTEPIFDNGAPLIAEIEAMLTGGAKPGAAPAAAKPAPAKPAPAKPATKSY